MLVIEKIISSFLSLPGLFFLISLIITIYLFMRAKSLTIRILSFANLIMMYILFTSIGTVILVLPLESMYLDSDFQENLQIDYPIIILGGGIKYTGEQAYLSPYSLQRLVKGFEIYKKIETPIIFTGGVAIGQREISESELAGDCLRKMGARSEDIIIEDQARTTYENGLYTKRWLLNYYLGDSIDDDKAELKAYLVTNALHMSRSVLVFEKQGIDVIPVSSGIMVDHKISWLSYLPNREALTANMMAIHEWVGLIWYKITGRI